MKLGRPCTTTAQKIATVNALINRNSVKLAVMSKTENADSAAIMKLVVSNRNAVNRMKRLTHTRKKDMQ